MPTPTKDVPAFEADDFDPDGLPDQASRDFAISLRRDGFAVVDLGDEARALCDLVVHETTPFFSAAGVDRVQDAWRDCPSVRRLAVWPRVSELLRLAYGREPFAFQTLNFEVGTEQALHSDMIHFSSQPERFMCGVWLALEDISADAGPLTYMQGSHVLPTVTMSDVGVNRRSREADYPDFVKYFADRISESNLQRKYAVIPKGWAFVWAANLAHGGSKIERVGATRRSMVTHHYFENCVYYTPLMSDEQRNRLYVRFPPDIGRGFPRLSRRAGWPVVPSPSAAFDSIRRLVRPNPFVQIRDDRNDFVPSAARPATKVSER